MNKKGTSMPEMVVGLVIAAIIFIAGTLVILTILNTGENSRQDMNNNLSWSALNYSLSRHIRGASYVFITNAGQTNSSLELFDFNTNSIGIYNNTVSGVTFTASGSLIDTFENTQSIFDGIGQTVGQSGPCTTKIRVTYTAPFNNLVYLNCRTNVQ